MFENDRVRAEVDRQKNCKIVLKVFGKTPLVTEARKEAIRHVAKEVSLPGFRKGKVPADLLEKKHPSAIVQEWEKTFANIAFKEAEGLAQIPLLNNNAKISYKLNSLTKEKGEIDFTFESEPSVPDIDVSQFQLKQIPEEPVTEEKVNETIKSIQMFYARWEQVTDREIKEGDFVVLDIDDIDQDPPVQAFTNVRFEVYPKKMASWMRDLVLGQKVGATIEGVSKPDESESEEVKKDFKPKKVRIHIKGVEEALLPPLDDELAKKVGVPNVDALKIQLKNLLITQKKESEHKQLRDNLTEQMLEKVQFDVPASILEKEANHRLGELFKHAGFARKWNEEMNDEEKEAKKSEIIKQSEDALRLFYICRKIVTENHLTLKEEELAPTFGTLLEMMFADPSRVNYHNLSKEQQAIEFSKFMVAKAQDYIINKIQHS